MSDYSFMAAIAGIVAVSIFVLFVVYVKAGEKNSSKYE